MLNDFQECLGEMSSLMMCQLDRLFPKLWRFFCLAIAGCWLRLVLLEGVQRTGPGLLSVCFLLVPFPKPSSRKKYESSLPYILYWAHLAMQLWVLLQVFCIGLVQSAHFRKEPWIDFLRFY